MYVYVRHMLWGEVRMILFRMLSYTWCTCMWCCFIIARNVSVLNTNQLEQQLVLGYVLTTCSQPDSKVHLRPMLTLITKRWVTSSASFLNRLSEIFLRRFGGGGPRYFFLGLRLHKWARCQTEKLCIQAVQDARQASALKILKTVKRQGAENIVF